MSEPAVSAKYSLSKYSPSSFEERGAAAPFTAPALSSARVRLDDRHNLVLLTPGFSGTDAVYVLPWTAIPDLFTMTVHDRALYEMILTSKATTPTAIRRESLRVMASGLAGPEAKAAARKSLDADEAYGIEIQATLLISLLFSLNVDVSDLVGLDFTKTDMVGASRRQLAIAVRPLGIDPDTAYERMERLAETLAFIGLPSFGTPGRLRLLLDQVRDFRLSMTQKAERADGEVSEFHRFAAEVAGKTVTLSRDCLAALDAALADLPQLVRNWAERAPEIRKLSNRLSWLLDGWDYVLGFAKGMEDWSIEEFWANIETLSRLLPMIPRAEAREESEGGARYAQSVQRRRVVAMQDWRTGVLDRELVSRLELAKIQVG